MDKQTIYKRREMIWKDKIKDHIELYVRFSTCRKSHDSWDEGYEAGIRAALFVLAERLHIMTNEELVKTFRGLVSDDILPLAKTERRSYKNGSK